jgi:small-conductance mechanosensitive channel
MKQKLPVAMIALGVAFLVFGLLSFEQYFHGYQYPLVSRLIAAIGALGLAGGLALRGGSRT